MIFPLLPARAAVNVHQLASACLSTFTRSPGALSLGWILCGNENVGSSRIHGLNLHWYLRSRGVLSFVLHSPAGYVESLDIGRLWQSVIESCAFDLVIFQRVHGGQATNLIRRLRSRGTTTAFFAADLYDADAIRESDCVFVASAELKRVLVKGGLEEGRVFVVLDAIETAHNQCKCYGRECPPKPIKVVWIGDAGHWQSLARIRSLLESDSRLSNYQLVSISNHPEADIRWRLKTVWDEVMACDIAIVPADTTSPVSIVKSNNRVTALKALGLPVICSRLPAYGQVIVDGQTGFFAETDEEWVTCLLALGDPDLRRTMGLKGRDALFARYGIEAVGAEFQGLIRDLVRCRS